MCSPVLSVEQKAREQKQGDLSQWCMSLVQGDGDGQAQPFTEQLQAQLLHPLKLDAEARGQWTGHGVCHQKFLPAISI